MIGWQGGLDRPAVDQLSKQDPTVWQRLRIELGPVQMPLDRPSAEFELRLPR